MSAMVIVGAGECGARAAATLREAGWSGPIDLIGAEQHLPYERPPLSKTALLADADPEPKTVYTETALQDLGIRCHTGLEVTDVDRRAREVILADGRRIHYERMLLATGAVPRTLPLAAGHPHAYALRTHQDLLRLRSVLRPGARVTVIGGGFIGLELAASATALDCRVTVIEAADRLLARAVPSSPAASIQERHTAAGVTVRCGVAPREVTTTAAGTSAVALADGNLVEHDVLIVGIGALPETTLADKIGLSLDNGIMADERLATSDPNIFAAGDCCSFPHPLYGGRRIRLEAWRNAHDQAVTAAHNMLGADRCHDAVPWFWSDQYDVSLQVAGLPNTADREVHRVRTDGVTVSFGLDDDGRLISAAALGTGNSVAKDIRLAERAIARRAVPDPAALADPSVSLKEFLR